MRLVQRVLSALLALALLVGGVIALIEIILADTNESTSLIDRQAWRQHGLDNMWTADSVRAVLYGGCAAAAILIIVALARPRPLVLAAQPADDMDVVVRRRGLQASLGRAVRTVDGIGTAKVKFRRRTVRVKARARWNDTSGLPDAVTAAVTDRLAAFQLAAPPNVKVAVRAKKGS